MSSLASWDTINQTLSRQQNKKLAERQMRQNQFNAIADMIWGRKEREAEQEFQAGETALGREHEAAMAEEDRALQREGYDVQRELQRMSDLAAAERIGLTGEEQRKTIEAQTEQQQQLQDDAQEFQRELAAIENAADLEQLQMRIDAEIAAAERAFVQPREEYEEQSTTIGGRTYSWTSDQEYELVALKMQSDMINDRIRLEASLRDEDLSEDERTKIQRAYEYLLENILYDRNTGQVRPLDEFESAWLEDQFETFLSAFETDNGAFEPYQRDLVRRMFFGPESEPPPTEISEGPGVTGYRGGGVPGMRDLPPDIARDVASTVTTGQLGWGFEPLGTNYWHEGVEPQEEALWQQLMSLRENATTNEDASAIVDQINILKNTSVSADDADMLAFIDEMLRKISGGPPPGGMGR